MIERPPAEPGRAAVLADLDAQVRRVDEARWLAARFAPAPERARLAALYAFHHEIARVREVVSDPLVGEIRLAWWREAVGEIYAALAGEAVRVRRHPAAEALAAALADPARRPDEAAVTALIDARAHDLEEAPFADMAGLAAYAEATAGGLMTVAARLLAPDAVDERTERGLRAAGRAWGLTGHARAFPVFAAQGWLTVPEAPSSAEAARILQDRDVGAVQAATAPLRAAAREALVVAREALRGAPAEIWPAYGYAALVEARLRELGRRGADVFALAAAKPGLADRARLVLAAARGGI